MPDPRFFDTASKIDLDQAVALTSARLMTPGTKGSGFIGACAPLSLEGTGLDGIGVAAFFSDRRYLANLRATRAEFVFVSEDFAADVPATSIAILSPSPQASWARLAARLYKTHAHEGHLAVHPGATLEAGVQLGVGVVIGQGAQIGAGTRIDAYAVIGPGVCIGRDCHIGPHVTIECALIGDRVKLAPGARVGQSGFGVSGDAKGLVDVPQLGRVILQDDVSLGADTCVDRGAFDDTVIGEGSKIDNMVQVGHNCRVGRNCIFAACVGLSGSVTVGDGALFGGRAAVADHLTVGAGAKLAGGAHVYKDVPPGALWGGFPAKAVRTHLREVVWLEKAAAGKSKE